MADSTKNTIALIKGAEITLGRNAYVIPPAPFACVEKYEAVFMGRDEAPTPAVMFDILLMSLQRNYPELKRDDLLQDVDISNMGKAFAGAMQVNAEGAEKKDDDKKK